MGSIVAEQVGAVTVSPETLDFYETLTLETHPQIQEQYGRSMSTLRELGLVAVVSTIDQVKTTPEYTLGLDDFTTAVEEHMMTDTEFGDLLHANRKREHEIVNAQTVTANGTPLVDVVSAGVEASLQAARKDVRMYSQVERDRNDLQLARAVDQLEVGEMCAALSKDPTELIHSDPEFWEGEMGYRKKMSVFQVYWKKTEDTLITHTLIIHNTDVEKMRVLFADYGKSIPADIKDSEWILNQILKNISSEEEFEAFIDQFRNSYELLSGQAPTVSLTQFMNSGIPKQLLSTYFDKYILPMSSSLSSGKKVSEIHDFVSDMYSIGTESLNPEDTHGLLRILNRSSFDIQDSRFLDEIIRFTAVEGIRKMLPQYLKPDVVKIEPQTGLYESTGMVHERAFNQDVASNLRAGRAAERTYGGCSSAGLSSREQENAVYSELDLNNQDVYGGSDKLPDDKYGSRYFYCPKRGCLNVRPKDQLIPKCQKCRADVSCG